MEKRIEKWDILKFGLIFLVVFGHVIDTIFQGYPWHQSLMVIIYSFHMPVFIFVSGLFSKKNINQKRYNKIIVFLFMFFILKALLAIGRLIGTGEMGFYVLSEQGLPWYMLVMFAFQMITIAVRKFSPKYIFILAVVLACFAGYDTKLDDTLCIMRILVFYPFFYLGYSLDPNKIAKVTANKKLKIISAVVFIGFIILAFAAHENLYYFRPLLSGRNPYLFLDENFGFGVLIRLAYYAIAFIIGFAVICLTPDKLGKKGFVAKLGSRTLQIYSLHFMFIYLYLGIARTDVPPAHPFLLALFLSVAITAICSLKIWTPIFDKIMNPKLKS